MVAPGVGPGLDRGEAVAAVVVGHAAPGAREVRVEWGRPVVPLVQVSARGVRLPDLDERVAQWLPIGVEQSTRHRDALAQWLTVVLARQVVVTFLDTLRT